MLKQGYFNRLALTRTCQYIARWAKNHLPSPGQSEPRSKHWRRVIPVPPISKIRLSARYSKNTQNSGLKGCPCVLPNQLEVQDILNEYLNSQRLRLRQIAKLTHILDMQANFVGNVSPYDSILLPQARRLGWKSFLQTKKHSQPHKNTVGQSLSCASKGSEDPNPSGARRAKSGVHAPKRCKKKSKRLTN